MSWIRTAVHKAVEVGGKNNLTRTVRNYADSVVGNAVSGGARILHLQDRISARNLKSFSHTVKRVEEVSVSCRGIERVQLLRRWLVALKEVDKVSNFYDNNQKDPHDDHDKLISDDYNSKDSPKLPTLVYYVDTVADEPKNFREVFLYSQALEGITLSMILEAPNDEEVSLLMEIYGLCLTGGKEVHFGVMRNVQALAKAFSGYNEEVLVKREELLQFAQGAIAGLKINSDLSRIDAEASSTKEELEKIKALQKPLNSDKKEKSFQDTTLETVEGIEQALAEVRLYSNLEVLLLKKKSLSNGDSPKLHDEKVHKLKILSESLANSTSKAEKRILDSRYQKEEALNFRLAKANEVFQIEKELITEIGQFERKRDELEAELKKVNHSLAASRGRLHNVREERDQFDEASNQILVHLKTKEDELSRSVASCRTEASVVDTWIEFLEDTWALQSSYTEQKQIQVKGELERFGENFVNLVIHLLSTYKDKLGPLVNRIRKMAESLSKINGSKIPAGEDDESSKVTKICLEEEYVDAESKILTTFSVVDTMEKQFYVQTEGIFRKDEQKIKDLFDAVERLKDDFESIQRPILEIESPTRRSETPFSDKSNQSPAYRNSPKTPDFRHNNNEAINSNPSIVGKNTLHSTEDQAELTKLVSEYSKIDGEDPPDEINADEINDWEFDALDKD